MLQDRFLHFIFRTKSVFSLTLHLFQHSGLTRLDLGEWQVPVEACAGLFPAGRQLPRLQNLTLGPCFLDSPVQRLVSACPNIKVQKRSEAENGT